MEPVDIDWGANTILDRSGNSNVGTLIGLAQATSSVSGKYGQAMRFATSTAYYISVANSASLNLASAGRLSYSLWVRFNSVPVGYSSGIGKITANFPSISFNGGSGISFNMYGSVSPGQLISNYNGYQTTPLNTWYHIVGTYDGATTTIYANGVRLGSQAATGTPGNSTSVLRIGNGLPADLDEVRVYNRALSAQDVSDLYNATSFDTTPLTPPATPTNFISTGHSTSTASFSWSANAESNLSNYYIYKNNVLAAVIHGSSTSYVLRNLLASTTYQFSLSAVDSLQREGATTTALIITTDQIASIGSVTPYQYLASKLRPVFKPGNTLLPLTKWSWPYTYDLNVEMARWGYALDFGDADIASTNQLANPNSDLSKMVALASSSPDQYKLSVNIARVPNNQIPPSAYTIDGGGNPTSTWSPEASDSLMTAMAATTTFYLQKVLDKAPAAIILNGGERLMSVIGVDGAAWGADPGVVAAKGALSWSDYQSQRKSHQESFFKNATHAVTNAPYIWYFTGNQSRTDGSFWYQWDWDYQWMKDVADYPNASMYYKDFNSGWTGNSDMLSVALNAFGHVIGYGHKLSYNWVNDGYFNNSRDSRHGDLNMYRGFLKTYYTAGMIGGVAGYFAYPTEGFAASFDSLSPPHWLEQIEALSQIHAEFSYLEDMIRQSDLLPGPNNSTLTASHPAYEFPTGHLNTRVLARKMTGHKRWLITSWAADGVERNVNVTIPTLGTINVFARPEGSVYDARIVSGVTGQTFLDSGYSYSSSLNTIPNSVPDPDEIIAPAVSITVPTNGSTVSGSSVNISTTATDNVGVAGVKFYFGSTIIGSEITSTSSANTYSTIWDATLSSNGPLVISAVARDFSNNYATSTINVTVANVSTPTITTSAASSLDITSAALNGNVISLSGSNVTQHGFAWGTSATLSGGNTATTTLGAKSGTGAFTSSVSSLTCATAYYARAYATNSAGTGYGDIVSFTTSACPVAATPTLTTSSSGSSSSVQSRYDNLIAMGNITGANALAQQYPSIYTQTRTEPPTNIQPPTITKKVINFLTPNFLKSDPVVVTNEKQQVPEPPLLIRLLKKFSVSSFSKADKQTLPSEVVFAKPANLPSYDVTDQGDIHVLQGKPIELAIKTDKPVKEVVGYFTIKKIDRKTALLDLEKQKKTSQLAAVGASIENKLVLETFKYTDTDNDGIYTATIIAPRVQGEYDIMTILEYKDTKLGHRELHLTAVIDPEGYVYVKTNLGETRIEKATVTLLVKDLENKFVTWSASDFKQINPQTTDKTGNYSFLVPEGVYQLTVIAPGYYDFTGTEFTVIQGGGVHENIELTKRGWLRSIWRWFANIL